MRPLRRFRDHSYRQCWAYGAALAARRGAVSEHVAIECGDELVGLADVRVKKLPLVGGGLAYVSGGPLVGRRPCERLERCLEALMRHYVDRRGLTLRRLSPRSAPRSTTRPSPTG